MLFSLDFQLNEYIQVLVALLHICQVRHCVRKMKKMQVDVSSLFFQNIVRFASAF